MMLQNYTTFRDVYYHFECVTVSQFARFANPNGTLSNISLNSKLLPMHVDMIEESIYTASLQEPEDGPFAPKTKRDKAARRRRRRLAKRRAQKIQKSVQNESRKASGDEYDPDSGTESEDV